LKPEFSVKDKRGRNTIGEKRRNEPMIYWRSRGRKNSTRKKSKPCRGDVRRKWAVNGVVKGIRHRNETDSQGKRTRYQA